MLGDDGLTEPVSLLTTHFDNHEFSHFPLGG